MRAEAASRRIRDAFHHAVQPRPGRPAADDRMIPLAEAAQMLRDTQRGSDLDRFSSGLAETDDALLAFWACRVAEAGVPVYGTRIMAAKAATVPIEAMRSGKLLDRASRLTEGRGQEIHDFCALQVRRRDLAAHLGAMIRVGLDG